MMTIRAQEQANPITIILQKFTTNFICKIFDDIEISSDEIEQIIDNYEMVFSRFQDDSELSKLNKNSGGEMSELFQKLLKKNIDLIHMSGGYFHPFVDVESIGYSSGTKGDVRKIDTGLENILSINGNTLSLSRGYSLDFGGSGKGYLVDIIVDYIRSKGGKNFFVNFGGDIYFSGDKNGKLFSAGIENPFFSGEKLGSMSLSNISLSSSGTYKRNWEINGQSYHHILNPKTGENSGDIIMVSVLAQNTLISDALATTLLSMGLENARNFIKEKSIDALIVPSFGEIFFTENFKQKYHFR